MRILSIDEYNTLMDYLSARLRKLLEHENIVREFQGNKPKDYFHGRYPLTNCCSYVFDDCIAYRVNNNLFIEILRSYYPHALLNHSDLFKTGDAKAIIQALYNVMPTLGWSLERFAKFLSNEISIYCILKRNSGYGEILRIDLFRKLCPNKMQLEKFDFIGGVFHLMKHFSIGGLNLSVGKDRNDIFDIENLIWLIICSFVEYIKTGQEISINENHVLKASFYKEAETDIYYINTLYKATI